MCALSMTSTNAYKECLRLVVGVLTYEVKIFWIKKIFNLMRNTSLYTSYTVITFFSYR